MPTKAEARKWLEGELAGVGITLVTAPSDAPYDASHARIVSRTFAHAREGPARTRVTETVSIEHSVLDTQDAGDILDKLDQVKPDSLKGILEAIWVSSAPNSEGVADQLVLFNLEYYGR